MKYESFSLTLTLSRWARETLRLHVGQPETPDPGQEWTREFPLPAGEGQGEGERSEELRMACLALTLRPTRLLALVILFLLLAVPTHAQKIVALGITEPILDATLSAPVAGIVAQRKFKEGDFVKQGAVLIELDKRLEELDVTRRKAVHDQARNEFEITKALHEKPNSSTPKVDVEKRELEYKVAKVEYDLAEENLRRRHVFAPFDGAIAEMFLQVGEACQIQQPVLRIVDTRRCYFVSNVEAKAAQNLKPDHEVSLEIDAGTTPLKVTGKISFVSPIVDPASGLLKVKVVFDNPNGAIRPGVAGKMAL